MDGAFRTQTVPGTVIGIVPTSTPHPHRIGEWTLIVEDGAYTLQLNPDAEAYLGEALFITLPQVGAKVQEGRPMGWLEGILGVSDLLAPVSGRVVEVNQDVLEDASLASSEWILRIRP